MAGSRGCWEVWPRAVLAVAVIIQAKCGAQQLPSELTQQTTERLEKSHRSSEFIDLSSPFVKHTKPTASEHPTTVATDEVETPSTEKNTQTEIMKGPRGMEETSDTLIRKILCTCFSAAEISKEVTKINNENKSDPLHIDCSNTTDSTEKSTTPPDADSSNDQGSTSVASTGGSPSNNTAAATSSPRANRLKLASRSTGYYRTTETSANLHSGGDFNLQNSTVSGHPPTRSPKTRSDKSGQHTKYKEDLVSVQVISAESNKPAGYNVYENSKNADVTNRSQGIAPHSNTSSSIRVVQFSERSRVVEEDDDAVDSDVSQRKISGLVEQDEESIVRDCTLIIVFSCLAVLVLIVCKAVRYLVLWKLSRREERLQVFTVATGATEASRRTLHDDK